MVQAPPPLVLRIQAALRTSVGVLPWHCLGCGQLVFIIMQAHLTLVLDGYSAPLTAGNFVRNVLEGAYTNAELKVDQGAVLAGGGYAGSESFEVCTFSKARI